MSDIANNLSYIMIPVRYGGKKDFNKMLSETDSDILSFI